MDDQPAVRLRVDRKFNRLAELKVKPPADYQPLPVPGIPLPEKQLASRPKEVDPVFITADQVEERNEEVTEAEGHVELRKDGTCRNSFSLAQPSR